MLDDLRLDDSLLAGVRATAEELGITTSVVEEAQPSLPERDPNQDYPRPPVRQYDLAYILDLAEASFAHVPAWFWEGSNRRASAVAPALKVETYTDEAVLERLDQVVVTGLANHSKKVQPGDLFFCIKGRETDGHLHAAEAVQRGAVAVVANVRSLRKLKGLPEGTVVIEVDDTRAVMGRIASEFYERPSTKMRVVGITGTNGKTTTSWLIRGIFEEMEQLTGIVGTIEYALAEDQMDENGEFFVP